MNNRTFLSVSLAVLCAVAVLAVAAPAVAAQDQPEDGEVNVFLEPDEAAADTNETQEYELVVADADDGIGAYELNVSTNDTSVAEIVGYSLTAGNAGQDGPFDGTEITADNGTLMLEVALGGAAHDANNTDGEAFTIATLTVNATGEIGDAAALTVSSVADGLEVATPEVGEGNMSDAEYYDVLNLPTSSLVRVDDEPIRGEVSVELEPPVLQSPPGEQDSYDVVVSGASEAISAYNNLSVEIENPETAQFVDITETGDIDTTSSEIRDGGASVFLNATLETPLESDQPENGLTIAELGINATGAISSETAVGVENSSLTPEIQDGDGTEYRLSNVTGSQFRVTADLDLRFSNQTYGDAVGGVVTTLRDVDSDDQNATILLTYEDGNDTVVAGLATGVWDGESVTIVLEDLGGLTETGDGLLAGEHTARITLADQLSSDYEPGDVLSEDTANSIVESATATVTEPDIPALDGLDIAVTDGFTIGDNYPLNQRGLFAAAESLYGLSGIPLPPTAAQADERFAPIADGQHVGITGLPVQDDLYEWATPLVGFQSLAPTQSVAVSFDGDETSPVTVDYSDARAHGLQVAEITTTAGENIGPTEYDLTVNNTASEILVEFDEDAVGPESPTVWLQLVWEATDPVEGLSVDRPNSIDYETDHRVVAANGDTEKDNFITFEAGATGISHADTDNDNNGFLGVPASDVELDAVIESDGAADGTANDGSFLVWEDQRVTFETAARGDTVDIYNVAVNDEGNYTLGSEISQAVVGFDDTAPGRVANLNTSNLTAGQKYFVTFGGDLTEAVVLDVRPLALDAETTDEIAFENQSETLAINVTAEDTTGGAVEAWFHYNGTNVSDVVHVERGVLTGDGNRTLEVIPSENDLDDLDLVGPGEYTVTVLHTESGVTAQTSFTILPPPSGPTLIEADDVSIESPDLTDPAEPGIFDRGDIIEIELELDGGNVATVTFGNESDPEQNMEVHATVYDPTWDEGDGPTSVTVYLNTYQIGQGMVETPTGFTANQPSWVSSFTDRQHGFFTDPSDPTAALVDPSNLDRPTNAYAGETLDIYGGSQGGAVLSPGDIENGPEGEFPGLRYDLHAAGNFSPHILDDVPTEDVNALDIEQRATNGFTIFTAPGEGENALHAQDPTTVTDIESLKSDGIITELDIEEVETSDGTRLVINDTIAENDYLIVEADSSGLEGVMHEAVQRNSTLDVASFLDRSDHLVTDEFRAAIDEQLPRVGDSLLDYEIRVFENLATLADRIDEPTENVERFEPEQVVLDLQGEMDRVLSGLDANENLQEYVIPYQLEPGDELLDTSLVDPNITTLEGGLTFDTEFSLEPSGGEQAGIGGPNIPTTVNPALDNGSLGVADFDRFEYLTPAVSVDDRYLGPSGLEVPTEANYTVTGTTTTAPGTTLDIEMLTVTGEGTPFFKQFDSLGTVEQSGDQPARWSVTVDFNQTRDNVEIQPGTGFTTDITRTGPSSGLAGGTARPGQVLADPALETFEFDDQPSDGNVVVVEAFEANRVAQIQIQDSEGTVLGGTELDRSSHEQFNIVLDEPVSSNTEVTAVATVAKPETGEPLGERTAEIIVEDESAPFFDLSELSPQSDTVEVGSEVTVEVDVENIGDLEGTQTVQLTVGGQTFEEDLTLAGGASQTVTFPALDTDELGAGEYEHTVSSQNTSVTGLLTVEEPPEPPEPPAPAEFEIVTLSPRNVTVTQGEEIVVDVTVQNVGETEVSQEVVLEVSEVGEVGSRQLSLADSEAGSVTFTVPTAEVEAGDYTHTASTANDSVEGSLTIEAQQPADDTDDAADGGDDAADGGDNAADGGDNATDNESGDDADGSGAGFGVVVAALALLGAALLAARRQVG